MLLSGGGAPLNTRRIDCTVKASGYAPNIPGLHKIQKALLSLHGISGLPSAFQFHRRGGVGAVISGVRILHYNLVPHAYVRMCYRRLFYKNPRS